MPDVQMTLETISERTRFNLRPILITVMIAKKKMNLHASKEAVNSKKAQIMKQQSLTYC
jgi:hypothetical protein